MTGRRLADRYELIQRVGTGGMAEVWEGVDHNLGRRIAIKVLHGHLAADSNVLGRFRSEAQAAARLTHPGIVGIYDTVTTDDTDAIIMELVSGRDLRTILDERPTLAAVDAVEVGVQLAAALGHAHQNGIIHRDVKPANILVRPDRRVKLSDFGIAKALDQTSHTESGSLVGTVKYLAPEQIEGHPVDGRTDLYGLTTVLYEMLCGQVPFAANDLMGAMDRLRKPAPSARKLRPDLSPALDAFLQKGLARNPADRYPDAATWSASLTEAMRGDQPSVARPSPGPDPTVVETLGPTSIPVRAATPPVIAAPSIPMTGPGPSVSRPATPRRRPKSVAEAPTPVAKHVKGKRKGLAWIGPLIALALMIAAVVTVWMLLKPASDAVNDRLGTDGPTSTQAATDILETGESTTAAPSSSAAVESSVTTEESTTTTAATTTTTTEAPFVAGVRSSGFDPLGDNNEHNEQASLALDGDPATFWRTESYATSAFGQIKEGVGLIVEFEEPRSMKDLEIIANRVGWSASLYEADVAAGSLEDWNEFAEFSDLGTEQVLDVPDISVTALMLWVTDLGLAADQTIEEYEAQVEAGDIVQQLRIFELALVG